MYISADAPYISLATYILPINIACVRLFIALWCRESTISSKSDPFNYILQGCFIGTEAIFRTIFRLHRYQWRNPEGYGWYRSVTDHEESRKSPKRMAIFREVLYMHLVLFWFILWAPFSVYYSVWLYMCFIRGRMYMCGMFRTVAISELTHCGLVKPYGGRDLGQNWFR